MKFIEFSPFTYTIEEALDAAKDLLKDNTVVSLCDRAKYSETEGKVVMIHDFKTRNVTVSNPKAMGFDMQLFSIDETGKTQLIDSRISD